MNTGHDHTTHTAMPSGMKVTENSEFRRTHQDQTYFFAANIARQNSQPIQPGI